jgi:DNA-binding LacI/PurR family transcriptional regulator
MYVNSQAVSHYSQRERLRGLIDGFGNGSEAGVIQFIRDDHDAAMSRLFAQHERPTAVVCYSHYEAVPLLKEAWERGVRVPDELSVIAFNDVFPLDCTIPPVTRVRVPADDIGRYAAEQLLKQIDKGRRDSAPHAKLFGEGLVVRESCAPPALADA